MQDTLPHDEAETVVTNVGEAKDAYADGAIVYLIQTPAGVYGTYSDELANVARSYVGTGEAVTVFWSADARGRKYANALQPAAQL